MEGKERRGDQPSASEEERSPEGAPGGGANVNLGWSAEEEEPEGEVEKGEDAPEDAQGTLPAA